MSEKLNEIAKGSFLRVNEEGKAYWGQSEGGGGGGVQVVTITAVSDGSENYALTSSHTGAEINAMALKGAVVANIKASGQEMLAAYFGCSHIIGEGVSVSFGACFTVGFTDTSTSKARYGAMYFYVEPETKKVSLKQVPFT